MLDDQIILVAAIAAGSKGGGSVMTFGPALMVRT